MLNAKKNNYLPKLTTNTIPLLRGTSPNTEKHHTSKPVYSCMYGKEHLKSYCLYQNWKKCGHIGEQYDHNATQKVNKRQRENGVSKNYSCNWIVHAPPR